MSAIETCSLCPRLCRTACPVATGAAREAAVPAQIAGAVIAYRQGRLGREAVVDAVTSCVDCGACQRLCHLHVPLPDALRALRSELGTAPPLVLEPPPEHGTLLAVVTEDTSEMAQRYVQALSDTLGAEVTPWHAPGALGAAGLEHADAPKVLRALAEGVAGRRVVVAHRGAGDVLEAAGVAVEYVWELVGAEAPPSCGDGNPGCCGGRHPFVDQHPDDATRMASHWVLRQRPLHGLDGRCAEHLRRAGHGATSVVERWLAELPREES